MTKKIYAFWACLFVLSLTVFAWSCRNSAAPEQESAPATEEVVTPEAEPELPAETPEVDTSAEQRPIVRQ